MRSLLLLAALFLGTTSIPAPSRAQGSGSNGSVCEQQPVLADVRLRVAERNLGQPVLRYGPLNLTIGLRDGKPIGDGLPLRQEIEMNLPVDSAWYRRIPGTNCWYFYRAAMTMSFSKPVITLAQDVRRDVCLDEGFQAAGRASIARSLEKWMLRLRQATDDMIHAFTRPFHAVAPSGVERLDNEVVDRAFMERRAAASQTLLLRAGPFPMIDTDQIIPDGQKACAEFPQKLMKLPGRGQPA
jgi:hypothetical protein